MECSYGVDLDSFNILQYNRKQAINVANRIYSDADFYLERKFVNFQIALKSKKEE